MNLWEERAARNEALFREVNEQVRRLSDAQGDPTGGEVACVCECSDDSCTERLHVTLAVYEGVRADPRHFLVAPGHDTAIEHVVRSGDGYAVVEKEGAAGRIADQTDPRAEP
jgi:hypothetical protein